MYRLDERKYGKNSVQLVLDEESDTVAMRKKRASRGEEHDIEELSELMPSLVIEVKDKCRTKDRGQFSHQLIQFIDDMWAMAAEIDPWYQNFIPQYEGEA